MSDRRRRRFLVPEVIQTSAIDCGPASLKSLLAGFGIPASYGRLREACQTDVDGTSINTIEEVAIQLGLEAEQILRPVDHLEVPEADLFPAVVVVCLPQGETHFVVVWRRHGPWLQLMDPGVGRRWVTAKRFLPELYLHAMIVGHKAWRAWAGSGEMVLTLERQLARLGLGRRAEDLLNVALEDEHWLPLATLEAAGRMTRAIVDSGGVTHGRAAARLLEATFRSALEDPALRDELLPPPFWSVQPVGEAELQLRGAILVRARCRRPEAAAVETDRSAGPTTAVPRVGEGLDDRLSPELAAAVRTPDASAGREFLRLLRADGLGKPLVLAAAFMAAGAGLVAEALVLRGFLDLTALLGVAEQRTAAFAGLLLLLVGLLGIEFPTALATLRSGRHLEIRLRQAFLRKIPLLGDRFFHSRPVSDMSERSHAVHGVRILPSLGGGIVQQVTELVMTTTAIVWLEPRTAAPALALAIVSLGVPIASHALLAERDLRVRTHGGALSRFYLDVLLGAVPVRVHRAEKAVARCHEDLLTDYARSNVDLLRATVASFGVQSYATHALAAWLVFSHLQRGSEAGVLLLVYWTLKLPGLGQQIGMAVRRYPAMRNVTQRLIEPLGAPEDPIDEPADDRPRSAPDPVAGGDRSPLEPLEIVLEGVSVRSAGHTILREIDLRVVAGTHLAIVGPSGAGKSTLLGLLLGWHRPCRGRVLIDGEPLDGAALDRLRSATAWVDPAIRIWNRTLLENLRYGTPERGVLPVAEVLADAALRELVEKLPEGLQTPLGEGGARLSGGEGQRLRLARAMLRPEARLAILDEPFRALERERRRQLLENARRHWRAATLLCVTHDIVDALAFDRVIVISEGRLVEHGVPAELASKPDSQFRRLLTADEEMRRDFRQGFGSGIRWRRLRLERGRIVTAGEDTSR